MLDEHVEFLERAFVQQKLDPLAGGQFPAGVLRLDALFAAAQFRAGAPLFEGVEDIFHLFPPVLATVRAPAEAGTLRSEWL